MVYYQFYFLFFTSRWLNGKQLNEPVQLAQLTQGGQVYTQHQKPYLSCALHGEKRLFRISVDYENNLTNAELNRKIYNYRKELDTYYQTEHRNDSEKLLYGVSVVVVDKMLAKVDDYSITMPVKVNETETELDFFVTEDNFLLTAKNDDNELYFADFNVNTAKLPSNYRHANQWQIEFLETEQKTIIAPLEDAENASHPILQFYAATWINKTSKNNEFPEIFNSLFKGELIKQTTDKLTQEWTTTFLTDMMPYLLMT
ncbi:MAG: hypothetical protein VSS52_012295, partial [Thiotrichaceae bacterium]|nr:hypothetical protein [Thiotrichaceae bacterium]